MVVKDRFDELEKIRENEGESKKRKKEKPEKNCGLSLDKFLSQVDEIRSHIQELRENTTHAKKCYDEFLFQVHSNNFNPDLKKKLNQELERLHDKIRRDSSSIHKELKCLVETASECRNSTLYKTVTMQHACLLREFLQVVQDFQKKQVEHRDRQLARMKLECQIAGVPYSEVEQLSEFDDNVSTFTQNFLLESKQAKDSLTHVLERHDEILKLEKSITEIHALFQEVAILVESQAESVDRIDKNINEVWNQTENAAKTLKEAKKQKRRLLKRKIQIAVAGTIVILTVIVIALV